MHESSLQAVWLVLMGALALESLAYWKGGRFLSALAFLPLRVERSMDLPPGTALSSRDEAAVGYRQPGVRPLAAGDLPWPDLLVGERGVGGRGPDFAWMRLTYSFFSRRPLGLARITATIDGSTVHLRSRWAPFPFSTFVLVLPFVVFVAAEQQLPPPAVLFAVLMIPFVVVVNAFWAWSDMRSQVASAMDQIESAFSSRPG